MSCALSTVQPFLFTLTAFTLKFVLIIKLDLGLNKILHTGSVVKKSAAAATQDTNDISDLWIKVMAANDGCIFISPPPVLNLPLDNSGMFCKNVAQINLRTEN